MRPVLEHNASLTVTFGLALTQIIDVVRILFLQQNDYTFQKPVLRMNETKFWQQIVGFLFSGRSVLNTVSLWEWEWTIGNLGWNIMIKLWIPIWSGFIMIITIIIIIKIIWDHHDINWIIFIMMILTVYRIIRMIKIIMIWSSWSRSWWRWSEWF